MYSPELGSFQDLHISSSSNQMQSWLDMHQDEFQSIYRKFPHGNQELGMTGNFGAIKEVTKCVNSFVIVEKKVPADSNTEDHSTQKKF